MKFIDPEEQKLNTEEKQPVEVYSEKTEPETPEIDEAQIRALALAYARYLKENDLTPGDPTFIESDELELTTDTDTTTEPDSTSEDVLFEDVDEPEEELLPETELTEEELFFDVDEPQEEEEILIETEETEPVTEPEAEPAEEELSEETEAAEEETFTETEESEDAEAESEEDLTEEPVEETVVEPTGESAEEFLEEPAAEPADEPEAEPAEEELSEETEAAEEETFTETEEAEKSEAEPDSTSEKEEPKEEDPKKKAAREAKEKAAQEKLRKRAEAKEKQKEIFLKGGRVPLAGVTTFHDKVQDGIDGAFATVGKQIISGTHRISSTYKNSRRGIGLAILVTGLVAAIILIVFDRFTVYEYAYNGKVLGYVKEQEVVTDVLDVAAKQLSTNNGTEADVEFVANQNITFNPTDSRGKSTDDADTVVNKLIYMTDIETEAYAVYDGDSVVAIVKDQNDADELLLRTKDALSVPDKGMELVSADFTNDLAVKPVNVLLGSVQSNVAAQEQMINGGDMHTYHIVEEGETIESLAAQFGVEVIDIYDDENDEPVTEIEQGDRICIRSVVEPVSVKMVESGKLKETIEYETIKKETDEYYKGDTYLEQEGQNGVQIFEGTITKISGEVTSRKETSPPEIIREKKDKIILVGTAERPKTAATGTFIVPIKSYVVTSEWGYRWGRLHEGMDFGAGTGTPIYASDGGKVIKANYWSGHGLCVEIDHGNGVITRYSHCSATMVSVGDLVYQGQHIANVGNTGHSFGSHLHFEVRVNGSSQNPRKYISP